MRVNTTDEIFVEAAPEDVYRALVAIGKDVTWWPGARSQASGKRLALSSKVGVMRGRVRFEANVDGVRPDEGLTWWLDKGDLRGRAEWWLEPFKEGTIVHYYLDVERGSGMRRMSSRIRRHRWAIRRGLNALKDSLEAWRRRG